MPSNEKRTKKKNKNNKPRRVKKSKLTKSKKPSKNIKPEKISKILSNIHILLSFPSIEFLPSTNIFLKNNTGHYIQMIDYQELGDIINQNTKYKKSPTIQKLFNYESYELKREEEIIFNYNNVKCDNLVIKEQKNYNIKLLFLYLLECNVQSRLKEIIQYGGDDDFDFQRMIEYDMEKEKSIDKYKKELENRDKDLEKEKELERVRELEREKFEERRKIEEEQLKLQQIENQKMEEEKKDEFEREIKEQTQMVLENKNTGDINEDINQEKKILTQIEEEKKETEEKEKDFMNIEERNIDVKIKEKEDLEKKLNEERKQMIEKIMNDRQEIEKRIEIKLKGFEEFLENKKVVTASKNSFVLYNVNWFNVCCGFEKLDDVFEEEVNKIFFDMGLIIDEKEIRKNLEELFKDEKNLLNFKNMIKNRLLSCSEIEPAKFFEKLFSNSFGTFKNCDQRSPQSILYLYDDYRTFLEKEIELSKLQRVLILIYCETRQHHLSKYLSIEVVRRQNDKKRQKNIIKILDKIMDGDREIIKHNDKIIEERTKIKYKEFKQQQLEEAKERNRFKKLVNENNLIIQKDKVKELVDERDDNIQQTQKKTKEKKKGPNILTKIANIFEKNKNSPIFDLSLTPKERIAYEKAVNNMKGGDSNGYKTTEQNKQEMCNKIKGEKNIYKEQLDMIDYCFN